MRPYWILFAICVVGLIVLKGTDRYEYSQIDSEAETDHSVAEDAIKANKFAIVQTTEFAKKFVAQLKQQKPLAPLLRSDIVFVFHTDNRCDGNTDGLISKLPAAQIDSSFNIQVTNDGDAWDCEKKSPSSFEIEFSPHKRLSSWERFEAVSASETSNSFFVEGRGESDYLIVHVEKTAKEIAVFKIEYRSEDPG